MGKHHAEREQQTEHAARGAHGGIDAPGEEMDDQQLGDGRTDDVGEVVEDERPGSEQLLDRATEHPQGQHVEQQMGQAAVQETVGDHLPDGETYRHAVLQRDLRAQRPKREVGDQRITQQHLQQIDADVGDQQGTRHGRHVKGHGRSWPR